MQASVDVHFFTTSRKSDVERTSPVLKILCAHGPKAPGIHSPDSDQHQRIASYTFSKHLIRPVCHRSEVFPQLAPPKPLQALSCFVARRCTTPVHPPGSLLRGSHCGSSPVVTGNSAISSCCRFTVTHCLAIIKFKKIPQTCHVMHAVHCTEYMKAYSRPFSCGHPSLVQ